MTRGKRAVKNNERNYPVKVSIRVRKEAVADTNRREQLEEEDVD